MVALEFDRSVRLRHWVLMYEPNEDGSQDIKIAGYDRKVWVTEVLNRDGDAQVFATMKPLTAEPKSPKPRKDDLVTIEHSAYATIRQVGGA